MIETIETVDQTNQYAQLTCMAEALPLAHRKNIQFLNRTVPSYFVSFVFLVVNVLDRVLALKIAYLSFIVVISAMLFEASALFGGPC